LANLRRPFFSDINRTLLVEAGAALQLTKGTSERLLKELSSRVTQEAKDLYADVEAQNDQLAQTHPELRATFAGEMRCLRACSISNRQLQNHLGGPYFTGFLVNISILALQGRRNLPSPS
jgi:hypothetical protein